MSKDTKNNLMILYAFVWILFLPWADQFEYGEDICLYGVYLFELLIILRMREKALSEAGRYDK